MSLAKREVLGFRQLLDFDHRWRIWIECGVPVMTVGGSLIDT
jgi:hypothetical protein